MLENPKHAVEPRLRKYCIGQRTNVVGRSLLPWIVVYRWRRCTYAVQERDRLVARFKYISKSRRAKALPQKPLYSHSLFVKLGLPL